LVAKMSGGSFDKSGFKLFCGGLTTETDDLDLKNYFEKFGELTDFVVMKMKNSKRNRGFGFVSFKSEDVLEKVLKDAPHTINEREIDVKRAQPKDENEEKKDGSAMGDPEAKVMRKLFVGGLNYETTEEKLKEYFERYGPIEDHVIMKFPDSGRSRGFGFVVFEKSESVDKCQADRPHELDKKTVDLKRATPKTDSKNPESQVSVKKLYIGKLNDEISDDDLKEYFGQFGEIRSVDQLKWNETGKKRGFGFIEFNDTDPVDKIVLLGNHSVNDIKLEVKKALSKGEIESNRKRYDDDYYGGRRNFGGGGDRKKFGFSSGPSMNGDPRMMMQAMMSWMGQDQMRDMMNGMSGGFGRGSGNGFGGQGGGYGGGYGGQGGGFGGQGGGYGGGNYTNFSEDGNYGRNQSSGGGPMRGTRNPIAPYQKRFPGETW